MRIAFWIALALVATSLPTGTTLTFAAPPAQDSGPNLLQDGDFEWGSPWPLQDGRDEFQVAPPWRAWHVPKPPPTVGRPYNCDARGDYGCYWAVPEFRDTQKLAFAYRVHGGYQAQKYFTYGRMHQAGLMQQVSNIQPNTRLRFSIYMQAWMCFEFVDCNYGKVSDKPSDMHLKIGIDPTGGDNPFSPDIVWSSEQPAWDQWALFQVEAVARNSTVTVYTHSRVDWDWARKNNDVYVDDGSLVAIGQAPTARPTSPPVVATRPAAAQPTRATPMPTVTSTSTPTITPTPTDTPTPTHTPVRRVATLPPEDTATPAPQNWLSKLSGSSDDAPGGSSGVILLGVALFLSAVLIGMVVGRRGGPRVG